MAGVELLRLDDGRRVILVTAGPPACYLFVDPLAGGILINTPRFHLALAADIARFGALRFIMYPSARGACDVAAWRAAAGARTLAGLGEVIDGPVDERIDGTIRITGRLDFLVLPGATRATCALRSKGPPGIVFFGPVLTQSDGWPALVRRAEDWNWENRVLGAVGVSGLAFDYAFCDDYSQDVSRFGPGADVHVAASVAAVVA